MFRFQYLNYALHHTKCLLDSDFHFDVRLGFKDFFKHFLCLLLWKSEHDEGCHCLIEDF